MNLLRIITVSAIAVVGCTSTPAEPGWTNVDVPASSASGQPHLATDDDGTVWLSWLERVDSTSRAFRYAAFDGATWSDPQTVIAGPGLMANWADIPKLYPDAKGRHAAHYVLNSGEHFFANRLLVTQSDAAGSWNAGRQLHDDSTASLHGFASIESVGERRVAVWLDGRRTTPVEVDFDESAWGEMTLRAATVGPDGAIEQSDELDARVCDCCPTATVRTADGVLAAYRDRSDDEVRDIKLIRFDGTTWSSPWPLHDDGWTIHGCPVNGPALAANGDDVAAAWFTAAQDQPRVQVAFSSDGGRTFGPPTVVDADHPRGRVGLAILPGGDALVSWMGTDSARTAVKVARVTPRGELGEPATVAFPQSPAFTGIPQLAVGGGEAYVAWVDGTSRDQTAILMARRSIRALE